MIIIEFGSPFLSKKNKPLTLNLHLFGLSFVLIIFSDSPLVI
nr:MAG TPA: hypothetical protein [Crassvirales sp.]